ncbi:MAG: HAMP domain-containing protein [Deltaproteobacteria bacterium]|nr:HAMP domain-containing protein [Deltaproteobacteria bacterium]
MKRSVFAKIFAGYFLLTCVLAGGVFFFSYRISRHYYEKTLIDDLQKLCTVLLVSATPLVEQQRWAELDAAMKRVGSSIETRITVIDRKGRVLADSEKTPADMENHLSRPEVFAAMQGGTGTSVRYSTTVQENMLYVSVPIRKDGAVAGVLRASMHMPHINRMLADFRNAVLLTACAVMVLGLLVALIMSRRLTRPIRKLSNASRLIAAGDFNVRVFLDNNDELRDFADSFNTMTEKIRGLFDEVSLQKQELDSIIASMNEALLVLDRDSRIVLANDAFRRMAHEQPLDGRFFWEIIRVPELGDIVKQVRAGHDRHIGEVTFNDRIFLCSASYMAQKEEILLVLLDITEIRNIERMKKDFVVNVSHELRTPLTAIKGFVETMLDDTDGADSRRYLEIIKRHTDRLIHITKDLMSLARLEREEQLETQPFNLKALIDQVLIMYEARLREKQLTLQLDIDSALSDMRGDAFTIEQIFINLLDNAITYTGQGGVTITARREQGQAIISVSDTGMGIAADQLPRIFERFYVTDKSRSRKLGGTGLGLSIVKHIVLLHKGTIDVESTPGTGTKFTIRLPQ